MSDQQSAVSGQPRRLYETLEYRFTAVELFDLGRSLARETQHLRDLNAEKRNAAKAIASSIEEAELRIGDLACKINNRYELRQVEVRVILDEPKPGVKSFVRTDTGEVMREADMTPDEMQRELFPEKLNAES